MRQKFLVLSFGFALCALGLAAVSFAQEPELEFNLDPDGKTIPLPNIFKPNLDLSGRGFHTSSQWPQNLASPEVLETWQQDIGFRSFYRLQYNLWEIHELVKDKAAQEILLANYEAVIKKINDSGGTVILCLFGTPAGLGRVLDKKSPPWDYQAYKAFVKEQIRNLSCQKKYKIWYEVWSAPDLDDFFLGSLKDYLYLYRACAQAVQELEGEYQLEIPLGGPSVSWWFQNFDGNNINTPERSLIYELIRFCYHQHLPLDFISWHVYSADAEVDKELSIYPKKTVINLLRDWLSYFHFDRNLPLVISEWNYDANANFLEERQEKSYITASYILARLKNMSETGVSQQAYFCLEDFQGNKENLLRNTGVFAFDAEASKYKGYPKASYHAFRMLAHLGSEMFVLPKIKDEFIGAIATKKEDSLVIIFYNYLDPEIFRDYLSRNIATLAPAARRVFLNLAKSRKLEQIRDHKIEISKLRLKPSLQKILRRAQELNDLRLKFMSTPRNIKLGIKKLTGDYLYQRYTIDASCGLNCNFTPQEEKEIPPVENYQEMFSLTPYSVEMIVLRKKPQEPLPPVEQKAQPNEEE